MRFPYVRRATYDSAIAANTAIINRYSASNERWALSNLELEKQVGILKNRVAALSNSLSDTEVKLGKSKEWNHEFAVALDMRDAEIKLLKAASKCSPTNSKPKKKS